MKVNKRYLIKLKIELKQNVKNSSLKIRYDKIGAIIIENWEINLLIK